MNTLFISTQHAICGLPAHRTSGARARRAVTFIETMLAVTVLSLSAASVLTAFVTGQSMSVQREKRQQAWMLAIAMQEEIKHLQAFECDNWNQDAINPAFSDYDPPDGSVHPYVEADEEIPTAGERDNFDDVSDYAGYCDRNYSGLPESPNEILDGCWVGFRNRSGAILPLFSENLDDPSDFVQPTLFRHVNVYPNDLDGLVSSGSYIQVEVVVSDESQELARLSRVYGQSARVMAGRSWGVQPPTPEPCLFDPCNADVNDDGAISVNDLLEVFGFWGPCPGCPQDIDNSDEVDGEDLHYVIDYWGLDCSDS